MSTPKVIQIAVDSEEGGSIWGLDSDEKIADYHKQRVEKEETKR